MAFRLYRIFYVVLQVTCLKDLFQDENVFIAYGADKFSREDLILDSEGKLFLVCLLQDDGRHLFAIIYGCISETDCMTVV